MDPRFGHDFSHVRVHTDAMAGASADAIGALAYTLGNDIVFGAGAYAPRTAGGPRRLAHAVNATLLRAASECIAGLQGQLCGIAGRGG
jgi:hypothetical protein